MNTENIIENLMNGNIAAAKEETEDILYAKVSEAIDFITDDVVDAVYGIQEKKEKKKSAEDEITFAPSTEIEDDGEGMDPVDSEDSDIDNDGDSDESDDYLKNRRKVRKKEIGEGAIGDGRREFIYGMKIKRYEKMTEKQQAIVKQSWYNDRAEEERVRGRKR